MSKIGYKLFIIISLISIGGLILTLFLVNSQVENHFKEYINQEKREEINKLVDVLEQKYQEEGVLELDENLLDNYISNQNIIFYFTNKNGELIYTNLRTQGRRQEDFDLESANQEVLYDQNSNQIAYLYWQLPGRHRVETVQQSRFIENVKQTIFFVAAIIIFISLVVCLLISRHLTSPLLKMNKMAAAIARGDYHLRVKSKGNNEISELGDSLNQMSDRLEYLEKTREESTEDLAHELRTPLAIISNYLTAIKDGIFEADASTIEEMKAELGRLERLVNGLEKFAETEKKLIYSKLEKLNLKNVIKQSVANFRKQAENKGIKLYTSLEDSLFMRGDSDALKIVFNNLISNAIKYSATGDKVKVKLTKENNMLVIRVIDEGIGIPKKDLPYIFERFYRTDKSRSTKTGGTGLGLAIVRKLVRAHNGEVSAKSEAGQTIFKVSFPPLP
ncbi:ATP-binding protein [Fuchsiella alkaliacetigena]|nr:ATP-binding protein [Fuchsiella alkaliacetigena]